MQKTITILNVTKRYTKTGKGVNEIVADDGQIYTVWDPDFKGQLRRNATITGEVVYGTYLNRRTQTLRPIRGTSSGGWSNKKDVSQDILLNILATLILSAQNREVSEDSVSSLVEGLKIKFGLAPELDSFSEPRRAIKTIQVEDEEINEGEDEEESPVPVFKENLEEEEELEEEVVKTPKKKKSKSLY